MELKCLLFVLASLIVYATAQTVFNCPVHWYQSNQECFLFEGDSPAKYDDARLACSNHGAALVSVEDRATHTFIRNWLDQNDPFLRTWYTSGIRERVSSLQQSRFIWEGAGTPVSSTITFWNKGIDRNNSNGVIVYRLQEAGYGWSLVAPEEPHPYICQVSQAEAYRIVQDERDFDYGLTISDLNVLQRGPHFTLQPDSTVVVGKPKMAQLECVADAHPAPTYKWYRGKNFDEEITSELDSRYTVTNGKLIFQNPEEGPDANIYRCTAENVLGLVISNEVQLTFGHLGDFSNVPDAAVNARAYDGVAIECSKIAYKPAVKYNWFKENYRTFVRPQYQTYQFISQNGKLYFSEVTRADEGSYHCIAILSGVNKYTIGTNQPPTRASLAIPLHVHDQAPKADWGPEIQDDFVAVFPQPPLKGQDVRLECFAYGSSNTPFHYSWEREGKPIPHRATLSDHNRVLTIPDAALEDQGTYTCHVRRSTNARDAKSVYLSLGARPYFISPLRDQHVDVKSQLTWRCDARANPPATYTWYKNGEVVASDPAKGIRVNGNVMRIDSLDPKLHDGMYQCGAVNTYGMTFSEGQLRVLAFPPSFTKHPLRSKMKAAIQGNATITCNPEGAPEPVTTWFKNGSPLSGDGNHVIVLPNGNLVIRNVQTSDQGVYMCRAENEFGKAESSGHLSIVSGTFITMSPVNTRVTVNNTAFFTCVASHDPLMDLVYTWYFNGKLLDTHHRPDLRKVRRGPGGHNGLYILNVDFLHGGYYECVAKTTLNEDKRGAWLTVIGPPTEPTGCFVDVVSIYNGSADVLWTASAGNGRPVSRYTIEMANSFDEDVWNTVHSESAYRIVTEPDSQKLRAKIKNLSPGNAYRFRVLAFNEFGPSEPSLPSSWIYMTSAPPIIAPRNVGGGGGSVGVLTLTWTPLERYEESGSNIGYKVYWRKHGDENALWEGAELKGYHDHYVTFVGGENYFLEYETKVQAFNSAGYGPNSSEAVVFSAEDLPIAAVTDVRGDGYNGTANFVTWKELPSTREIARGIILGYQVNYWLMEGQIATDYKEFIRVEGQQNEGIFIGLESDSFYYAEVRAYNSAGLGPRSEVYLIETKHAPAVAYPEEVRVYSAGHGQVLVWWRGIHILQPEANVHGFVLYFWPANEHYRTACEMIIHDHHAHDAHITVDPGVIYALRVSAWSVGGYGKKTPTMYFTLEGQVTIDRAFAKEIDVFLASAIAPSWSAFLLCLSFLLVSALV